MGRNFGVGAFIFFISGASRGLEVKVAEDHGRQKAAFYAGWMHGQGGGEEDFGNYGSGPGFGRGGRGGGGYRGRGGGGGGGADFGVGGEYDQGFQGFQVGRFSFTEPNLISATGSAAVSSAWRCHERDGRE